MKIPSIDKYIGITPLAIIGFGGSFVLLSLTNEGIFIRESFLVFIWGVSSSFLRQIYKDGLAFLISKGNNKYGNMHEYFWVIYYIFQAVILMVFTYLIFYQSAFAFGSKSLEVGFASIFNWNGWEWPGWEVFSVIVLTITACAIFWQAKETKKYTKYSVMPNCYFMMRGENFIVKNNSKFPVLFAVDIQLVGKDKNGNIIKEVSQSGYWSKPLFVYGEDILKTASDFLKFNDFKQIPNFTQKGRVFALIKYYYWPVFAPEEKSEVIFDNYWSFDFSENKWTGPNGAKFD